MPVISGTFWCQQSTAGLSFGPWSRCEEVKRRTKCKYNMGTGKVWEHRQDAVPFSVVIEQRAQRNTAESEAGMAKFI